MVATAPAYRHDGFMRPWGPLALLDITITLGFLVSVWYYLLACSVSSCTQETILTWHFSTLTARRQSHSVFNASLHVGTICLFLDPLDFCLVIQVLLSPRMNLNACQTRPRFNVSSEGRGATFASNTQLPYLHCPSRDSNLGLLVWEASVLPLDHRDFCLSMFLPRFLCLSLWYSQSCYDFFKADIWFPSSWSSGSVLTHLHTLLVHALICRQHGWHSLLQRSV